MPRFSKILEKLPQYPFAKVSQLSRKVQERDRIEVINVRIGIPDREAPRTVKEHMSKFLLQKDSTYGYPCDVYPARGIPELIEAIIRHYDEIYSVDLKPENIMVTNWTKEVLHNIARLFDEGRGVVPIPIYSAYEAGVLLSHHKIRTVPTSIESGWLPELKLSEKDSFFYFCDPNNPTASIADRDYYENLLVEMRRYNVSGIFDKAYKDYIFEGVTNPFSITEIPELMEYGFELVSLSKHYNFVGIGLGWIVSSKENIDRWMKLSSYFSQGVAWYKQKAAVQALTNPDVKKEMDEYMIELRERRDFFVEGLNRLGFKAQLPKATPYIFPAIPESFDCNDEYFALDVLLNKAHVAMMPGSYFGESGKGYIRATIFAPKQKIEEALQRIEEIRDW